MSRSGGRRPSTCSTSVIGGSPSLGDDLDEFNGFEVAGDRHRGYDLALRAAGVEPDPTLSHRTGFSIDGGEAAFHRLFSQLGDGWEMPTAIFAVCDEVAMGIMYAIREHGLRVPMDLSVVGVDGHDFAYLFDLTTVSQPVRDQGRIAARLLLEQINTRPPRPPSVVSVGSNLIRRASSGPVPRRLTTGASDAIGSVEPAGPSHRWTGLARGCPQGETG